MPQAMVLTCRGLGHIVGVEVTVRKLALLVLVSIALLFGCSKGRLRGLPPGEASLTAEGIAEAEHQADAEGRLLPPPKDAFIPLLAEDGGP